MDVITTQDQITIEWLSHVLGQSVSTLEVKHNPAAFNSTAAHVTVTYDEKSDLPENLFIKLKQNGDGKPEIQCYQALKNVTLKGVIPAYYAVYDAATGQSTLILKDVSQTHQPPISIDTLISASGVVNVRDMQLIIDTLANWHSYWWANTDFETPQPFTSREQFTARVQKYHADWDAFLAKGYTIPDSWHQTYVQALKIIPHLYSKYLASRFDANKNLTLIHGDCYITQFLVNSDNAYIADFDSVSRSIPTDDLVFLMTTFWTRDKRHKHENAHLRRYHQVLNQPDYTWDNLILDYRLMILYRIFHAVWDGTYADESYWRPKMRCSLEAYHDWHCGEL